MVDTKAFLGQQLKRLSVQELMVAASLGPMVIMVRTPPPQKGKGVKEAFSGSNREATESYMLHL